MSVTKPARWAVSPGLVDPQWRWAWRGLQFYLPMWDIYKPTSDLVGLSWVTRGFVTPDGGSGFDWGSTGGTQTWDMAIGPFGQGWKIDTPSGDTIGPTIRSELNLPTASYPAMTIVCVAMMETQPTVTFRQFWTIASTFGLEWEVSTSVNLSVNGTNMTDDLDAGSAVVLGEWYVNVVRVWEGSGSNIQSDIYDSDGMLVYTGTTTWAGTPTDRIFYIGYAGDQAAYLGMLGYWDRAFTDAEAELIGRDPFGPIRPALWGPELSVGATVTLYATADGTRVSIVNELNTTTNLYQSVDDDPSSPSDSDWINNLGGASGSIFFDLTDMPGTFDTMDAVTGVFRWRATTHSNALTLYAQLFQSDESTSLSDEVQVAVTSVDSSFTNTGTVTFTSVSAGSKAVWDAAKIRLRWA